MWYLEFQTRTGATFARSGDVRVMEPEHSESLAKRRSEFRRLESESEILRTIKEILEFHRTQPQGFFPARRAGQEMVFPPEQWRITYMCSRSCERSEQFARSSDPARALLIFQNSRASGRANKWSEAECFARGTSGRAPQAACPPRSGVATWSYAKFAAVFSQAK